VGTHDRVFRALLQDKKVAEALLRERLPANTVRRFAGPPEVLPTSFIDRALKEGVGDVLLRVPLRDGDNAYVYCLVEHKRTGEREVMLQLLGYLSALYQRLAREFPTQRLPGVVALVVYNGTGPWMGPRRLSDLIDATPDVKGLTLDFGLVIVDLRREAPEELAHDQTLRGCFMALKVAATPPGERSTLLQQAVRTLRADPSTLRLFLRYLTKVAPQRDRAFVHRLIRTEMEGAQMYTIEDAAKARGYRSGKKSGLKAGLEAGLEAGREEGREEGKLLALREAVTHVLRSRFKKVAPEVSKKLASTTSTKQLTEFLTRAATIKRAGELFSP
jgi:predicted transposase YdaD